MSVLFFDTETTGFPNKKMALDAPEQPHLLQLAAKLDNDDGKTMASLNVIVNNGLTSIPEESLRVHGLSVDVCNQFGIGLLSAVAVFHAMMQQTDVVVAHNYEFDLFILKIAYARLNKLDNFSTQVQNKPFFCTKVETTDICKIPSPYGKAGYKWPTLDEAYRTLVSPEGFTGAHDALNDVNACRDVFYSLKRPQEALVTA